MNRHGPTLIVSGFSSDCGACGRSANPHQASHDVLLGYGPTNGNPGCGVTWTHIVFTTGDNSPDFRPDLIRGLAG